ncbi:MAG: hypothetical protein R3C41_18200 [Calditrichia bacterium]|nr:hypothetical protein [Calditrichota bacterium]MCB0268681.1 hypothetical protein [Calditrichota bacterium]MCB0287722.1 hypothetical protein [Calditrichota bacterium]MCB9070823.1 hypothetical protein [Calditrichia bacterium]
MSGFLQTTIGKIITIVAVLAVGNSVYQSFFSDKARMLKELQAMIDQKEKQIEMLSQQYEDITKREKMSLQKIAELKNKLTGVQELINEGEGNLDEIKESIPNIDSDIDFLANFTRGTLDSLDSGRGVLGQLGGGPGN